MTSVKGTAIAGTVKYVTEKFGPEGLAKVLAEVTPEERATLEEGVLVSSWYPFPLLLKIMRSAHRHFGTQVPHLYHEMGRASADYGLRGVYKIFYKVGSPEFIISRAPRVMTTYYSSGEMRVPVVEKGHAIMELVGFEDPAPEFCDRLAGWMERTVELSGGQDLRFVHPECVNRGGHVCRFEGWWS